MHSVKGHRTSSDLIDVLKLVAALSKYSCSVNFEILILSGVKNIYVLVYKLVDNRSGFNFHLKITYVHNF